MKKKRLLFLMRDFEQAGAQRFQYELIRAIDAQKYVVDVLAIQNLEDDVDGFKVDNHYYPLIKKHSENVYFLSDVGGVYFSAIERLKNLKKKLNKTYAFQHILDFWVNKLQEKS